MTALRNGICGHPGVCAHEDAISHREWLSGHFELDSIERNSQQLSSMRVNQMPGWRVPRARTTFDQDLLLFRLERQHGDVRVVVRVVVGHADREEDRLARRKEGWMAVEALTALFIDLQQRRRRSTRRCDPKQVEPCKDDGVV